MDGDNPISWLTFFTLGAGIVIAGGAFIYFLRSRHNRYIAEQALVGSGDHQRSAAPDGALPELIGILVIGLVAMGLLVLGYSTR